MRAGFDKLGYALRRDRLAEQIALHFVATTLAQERRLLGGFDAFGDKGHAERLAHADDRLGDRPVLGILRQILDEGPIDLERVDRKFFHQRHRGIASSEIVDGETHAARYG